MTGWEMVVGLEVHVQLKTRTKMFCGCENRFGAPPNSLVCPVCAGMPGSLPTVNRKAVELGMMTGIALGCRIASRTMFDRKNYFYPDLPKGYQISQFDRPLASGGSFRFPFGGGSMEASITRAHLEEDSGKNVHDASTDGSFVDLNRAGVPLIEIVTGPVFRSAREVSAYLAALKQLLQYIGASDCNMERGSLRCEPNVSVRKAGSTSLGTKTEIKNINSFKSVEKALEYEFRRQTEALESGGRILQQTMLWDDVAGSTAPMRSKEEAHDYRYFPEPDIPPLEIAADWVERVRASMPELPDARKRRFVESFGLREYDAAVLTASRDFSSLFEECARLWPNRRRLCSLFITDLLSILADEKIEVCDSRLSAQSVASLLRMEEEGAVGKNQVREILAELAKAGGDPPAIAASRGMVQLRDEDEIGALVTKAIAESPESVADFRAGRGKRAIGFLMGNVVRAMNGKGDPKIIRRLLVEKLENQSRS